MMYRGALAACLVAGCGNVDDTGARPVTLVQASSPLMTDGIACTTPIATPPSYVLENSFYRAFTLADHEVTDGLVVRQVSFGVFLAAAGSGGTQPADVTIYAYDGDTGGSTLDATKLTRVAAADLDIPDTTSPTTVDVDIEAVIGAEVPALVVELHIGDGSADQHRLFIGTSDEGESAPAYLRSPACANPRPRPVGEVYPGHALVVAVAGDA
jgi:hypothetical protein